MPAEQVSFVLGGHGTEAQYAHSNEDHEKNDGNDENWHTSPLRPFWYVSAAGAVIAVTA
jgi:hypothetical protein